MNMMRPFPFVMVAAMGLLFIKGFATLTPNTPENIDQTVTGSIGKRGLSKFTVDAPLYNDDKSLLLVRTLNALPARDAAKIFANFDEETQIDVSTKLSPLVFADILSQLSVEKAMNYTKALNADVNANKTAQK